MEMILDLTHFDHSFRIQMKNAMQNHHIPGIHRHLLTPARFAALTHIVSQPHHLLSDFLFIHTGHLFRLNS